MLDQKHKEMMKRQMIKLIEHAATCYEEADNLNWKADLMPDGKEKDAYYARAEKLEKEADQICDMFPEFSISTIQNRKSS